ncbi:glycoside hydrolase family 31 protein [Micropruina sonneratiae]|uniref:glycoside hydrolase family 31 protein n=1 Tax=Micropruina sonneratiae TaxID=2986940 RepID=UPI002226CEB1|nr:glycoside hydrolase family 31 protein [Micropruina sp. KQZ13P-5]MCW3158842.1 glycoside hydrolase family 31 protein [Micropruina sp. KQZ13P-5]
MTLPERLILPTTPLAPERSQVRGETYRITVLTDSLFRLEYSSTGQFEDRATQTVINRAFEPVPFTVNTTKHGIEIVTDTVQLSYDEAPFSPGGLYAHLVGGTGHRRTWRYGERQQLWGGGDSNLGGTARTLDEVDGPTDLEDGVLGLLGSAVLDDSTTMALDSDGWVAARVPGNTDVYLFAHGERYIDALNDFHRLTGPQPLLPRWALGNWWSRYHPYTAAEYQALIERFEAERIPFSVAVLDMDWHLVDVPPEYGTGWTGYTWNRELFPDPEGFTSWLHEHGLKVSLNVHPADGVRAFEEPYRRMAQAMGIDPATEQPVDFDIADPDFLVNYLEQVHHPLEDAGVDFWWLDWQQGTHTAVAGLDPLWLLNHFHYLDSARKGRRPITFSRYAGPGSHRYPVGFSGDTINSWASLDFQPRFTNTAANIGFGWWSHDIGGHMFGHRNNELVTRWYQYGAFAPINRLHSTLSPFMGKEPWNFPAEHAAVMVDYLRLRHRLLPYLYTMNEHTHRTNESLCRPLYHADPAGDLYSQRGYGYRNTYLFGTELLVAPITSPADRGTGLAAVTTWLPAGGWTDFFTGLRYTGEGIVHLHRRLGDYPVLARDGAIVPLSADGEFGIGNPTAFEVHVFPGADGAFTLYEDDDAAEPRAVRTPLSWDDAAATFTIGAAQGAAEVVPAQRSWTLVLHGVDGAAAEGATIRPGSTGVRVELGDVATASGVVARVTGLTRGGPTKRERAFELLRGVQGEYMLTERIWHSIERPGDVTEVIRRLEGLDFPDPLRAALYEILLAED